MASEGANNEKNNVTLKESKAEAAQCVLKINLDREGASPDYPFLKALLGQWVTAAVRSVLPGSRTAELESEILQLRKVK